MINLNNTDIFIKRYEEGDTIETIKVGRKLFYMEIGKSKLRTYIQVYDYKNKDRNKFSKYDSDVNLKSLFVQNDAILNRDFFEHMKEIEKAWFLVHKYDDMIVL